MLRKLLFAVFVALLYTGSAVAQTGTITGNVTDATSGETLPGANVLVVDLDKGTSTDANGNFEITEVPPGTHTVRVTYVGYNQADQTVSVEAGEIVEVNFDLGAGVDLGQVVVTALGQEVEENTISFSSQEVTSEQLNIADNDNIRTSLAGKVAGVQVLGQAGSKLGAFGNIRLRGAISLTNDLSEPLYVVDGVPMNNPNMINMNDIEDVNVLKGPNATALYGQRGENGVILVTTKEGSETGVSAEVNFSMTLDRVAYLPDFQNKYGQGYSQGDFATFQYDASFHPSYFEDLDGARYLTQPYADESWGPRFDGNSYAPWYSWWPDSPYHGQTQPWNAQPNNVENFYDDGVTTRTGFALTSAGSDYSARASYTNQSQSGILPYSSLDKHFMSGRFTYDVTDRFEVGANFKYTIQDVSGDVRSDGYSNQTSGSFNQWFGRSLEADKMRELQDLNNPDGYQATWNWWGPNSYPLTVGDNGYKKPVFWFNSYKWMDDYDINRSTDNLLLSLQANYEFNNNWEAQANGNITRELYTRRYELPFTFENSADQTGLFYNYWVNSFGLLKDDQKEYNFDGQLEYKNDFGDISLTGLGGGTIRIESFDRFQADMDRANYQSGGLIIPNVYNYNNSRERIVPNESDWNKRVYSLYGKATLGYKDFLYLDGTYRRDWSSALPSDNNGYGYPSVGVSFIFSELVDFDKLSYGKLRAGWAQVGDDVDAEEIVSSYALSSDPYTNPATGRSVPLLFTDSDLIDPEIQPALNTSFEAGFDVRFYDDRIGLDATYYNEVREDEIIPITISSSNGSSSFITNAGSTEREGVELSLNTVPVRTQTFRWDLTVNYARNQTIVTSLPEGLDSYEISNTTSAFDFVSITQREGQEWGQLRGAAISRADNGEPILNDNGLYVVEQNQYLGSVLPDWTGGMVNTLSYKNLSLTAAIDFQKGGQFFSLSENWGMYSGLLKETAAQNDRGEPRRAPVSEDGGVHVEGQTPDGQDVDTYVPAQDYYKQWYSNRLAEPFIHDASYVKLRSLNLSYNLPQRWVGGFLQSAKIGVVARNLWRIYLHPENDHNWDPSELAETYGENGQLPGTRSYGVNVQLNF